jgi:hypothetical protein
MSDRLLKACWQFFSARQPNKNLLFFKLCGILVGIPAAGLVVVYLIS